MKGDVISDHFLMQKDFLDTVNFSTLVLNAPMGGGAGVTGLGLSPKKYPFLPLPL